MSNVTIKQFLATAWKMKTTGTGTCRGTDIATTSELFVTLLSHPSASYPLVGAAELSNAAWRIPWRALGAGNAGVGVWVTGWACDLAEDE